MKYYTLINGDATTQSHPARGAWIEIYASDVTYWSAAVAPRKGCVD